MPSARRLCLLLLVPTACQAPLAPTDHDILEVGRYAGTWEIAVLEEAETEHEPATEPAPQVFGRLEIVHRGGTTANGRTGSSLLDLLRGDQADAPDRLVVRFTWTELPGDGSADQPSDDETSEDSPIRFDAQLIEVDDQQFLTVQRFTDEDWLDPWATPLQRTFRFEEDPEDGSLRLAIHRLQLLWSPTPLAGRLHFDPDAVENADGIGLVQDLDDLLEFYANRSEDEWTPVLMARRVE